MSDLYIIAEAAQGYEGSVEVSKLLVRAAAAGGANAIKFQMVYAEDLALPGYEYYELFQSLELSQDQWQVIYRYTQELKLDFIVDVFGERSFQIARNIGVNRIKLHSTSFHDTRLMQQVFDLGIYVYLSIGGIHPAELNEAVNQYGLNKKNNICILYGFQSEPTPIESNNLARISALRNTYGVESIGFMDHSDGGGEDHIHLSVLALGMGVQVFEKHITLDRALEMEDYVSALSPSSFAQYCNTLRRLSGAIGTSQLDLTEKEVQYRGKALKRVVARCDCKAGTVLQEKHLDLSRPADQCGSYFMQSILGKTLKADVSMHHGIDESMV